MEYLPKSDVLEVLLRLSLADILRMRLVCQTFNQFISDNYLWKLLTIRDFEIGQEGPDWNAREDWHRFYRDLYESFDFGKSTPLFEVNQGYITAKKKGHSVLLATRPLSNCQKYWYWRYTVINSISDNMVGYGFAESCVTRTDFLGTDSHGWSNYSGRFYYHNHTNQKTTKTGLFGTGDFIEFLFLTKKRQCLVFKNGAYSHKFENLPEPTNIYPALCMMHKDSCIQVTCDRARKRELVEAYCTHSLKQLTEEKPPEKTQAAPATSNKMTFHVIKPPSVPPAQAPQHRKSSFWGQIKQLFDKKD